MFLFTETSLLYNISDQTLHIFANDQSFDTPIRTIMSAPAVPNGASDARDPSGFLSDIIGAPVTVKLNSGVVYKGTQILQDLG